jgi:hypothetical protein
MIGEFHYRRSGECSCHQHAQKIPARRVVLLGGCVVVRMCVDVFVVVRMLNVGMVMPILVCLLAHIRESSDAVFSAV